MASVDSLREDLEKLNLDTRGKKKRLRKRLRKAQNALKEAKTERKQFNETQTIQSFLVLDVEATCVELPGYLAFDYPNEIIEWPVILLQWNGGALEVVDIYHSFVRPMWQPVISEYCHTLTGIEQKDIDNAPTFEEMLVDFEKNFIDKYALFTHENTTSWVTDGPWDIRDFVTKSVFINNIPRPYYLTGGIINIRTLLTGFIQFQTRAERYLIHLEPQMQSLLPSKKLVSPALVDVLDYFSLTHIGRLHSGIDDTRNIAAIMIRLSELICKSNEVALCQYQKNVHFRYTPFTIRPNLQLPDTARQYGWMSSDGVVDLSKLSQLWDRYRISRTPNT